MKEFLNARAVASDMERDYVDVGFSFGDQSFIGEIKVTTNLTPGQAFRAALGQILDYAHLLHQETPKMIIFLDTNVEVKRLKLASSLGIAVVVEKNGNFILVNGDVGLPLSCLFETSDSTSLEPRIVEK